MAKRAERGRFAKGTEPGPGRPPLYSDPMLFEAKVESYFDRFEEGGDRIGRVPTMPGLAYELGFESRQSLLDYEKRDGFAGIVKRARLRIEGDRAERLVTKDAYTPGLAMDLATNHGWITDRGERTGKDGGPIENSTTLDVSALSPEQLAAIASIKVGGE